MLELDDNYFKEEERCGFKIPSMMKRVWAVEMDVLTHIDRICMEYGLTYYAAFGTMLGAVRHNGFVPWDDDIDIYMIRPDYQILMKVLSDELPEGYYNSSSYSDSTHMQPLTSVMNTKYIITDVSERKKKFYGCPYICGIDIFPLDYIPSNEEELNTFRNIYTVVYSTAREFNQYTIEERERYLNLIEEMCNTNIDRNENIQNQLWLLLDKVAGIFNKDECEYLVVRILCKRCKAVLQFLIVIVVQCVQCSGCSLYNTYLPTNICYNPELKYKKEWFTGVKRFPFEYISVPVANGYDELLKITYGDYMQYDRQRGRAHNYPFYKKQEDFLIKNNLM